MMLYSNKQLNTGRRALFSYRARYDVIEFSNCCTEEQSEAEFENIMASYHAL